MYSVHTHTHTHTHTHIHIRTQEVLSVRRLEDGAREEGWTGRKGGEGERLKDWEGVSERSCIVYVCIRNTYPVEENLCLKVAWS